MYLELNTNDTEKTKRDYSFKAHLSAINNGKNIKKKQAKAKYKKQSFLFPDMQ